MMVIGSDCSVTHDRLVCSLSHGWVNRETLTRQSLQASTLRRTRQAALMFVALNRFSTTTPNSGDNGDSAAQQVNKRASGCQRNHSAKSLMALSSLVVLAPPLFTNQQKTCPDRSSTDNENDMFFVFASNGSDSCWRSGVKWDLSTKGIKSDYDLIDAWHDGTAWKRPVDQ